MLTRRDVLSMATAMAAGMAATGPTIAKPAPRPQIAFTFDDPKLQHGAQLGWQDVNQRILGAFAKHQLKSVLFVCGMRIDSDAGRELIGAWDSAGHLIANHSYSHLDFNTTSLAEFAADTLKNEPLVTPYRHFARLFRYPFFKEGDTAEKRDGMRSLLRQHGYRMGRATIDASDWAISARLEKRAAGNPSADLAPYRDFFLQHIWERAQYYQSLAQRIVTHPVRHTVLLHHNSLNALFVDDLIVMFSNRGWQPIDAEYAYRDPVYDQQPKCLPAGESLIWALAKESGRFATELRYPGEDDTYENPKMDALRL
jgi:peptidoglycan/xylan/chitin deacetylase (PgdA/CDA1 family)